MSASITTADELRRRFLIVMGAVLGPRLLL
jgi:hypothetical protein